MKIESASRAFDCFMLTPEDAVKTYSGQQLNLNKT